VIYFFNPYSIDKDLGKAYNDYMALLPNDEDWACLTDGDTMFLMPDYGHQIQQIIDLHPETGLFTCLTNRVGCTDQCYRKVISNERDILKHKRIAQDLYTNKTGVKELRNIISGHCMIVQKKTWEAVGKFPEGMGILAVDNEFSKRILDSGRKILLMEGVYILHWYRFDTGISDKSHIK
jgi:GT2 family glycosyltransferase